MLKLATLINPSAIIFEQALIILIDKRRAEKKRSGHARLPSQSKRNRQKTDDFSCTRNLQEVQNGVFDRPRGREKWSSTSKFLADFRIKAVEEMIYEDNYAVYLILKRVGWEYFSVRTEQEFYYSRFHFAVDKRKRVHKI